MTQLIAVAVVIVGVVTVGHWLARIDEAFAAEVLRTAHMIGGSGTVQADGVSVSVTVGDDVHALILTNRTAAAVRLSFSRRRFTIIGTAVATATGAVGVRDAIVVC